MFSIFHKRSADQWHWQVTMSLPVDFAVWVLERDGLQVAPFDQHPEILGNRLLRDTGFTADDWQVWFNHLVKEAGQQQNQPFDAVEPGDFFAGVNEQWKTLLNTLWALYLPMSGSRRYVENVVTMPTKTSDERSLWETLSKVRGNLPPLHVLLTAYPAKTERYMPPATLLLSPAGAVIPAEDWEIILVRGIQALRGMAED